MSRRSSSFRRSPRPLSRSGPPLPPRKKPATVVAQKPAAVATQKPATVAAQKPATHREKPAAAPPPRPKPAATVAASAPRPSPPRVPRPCVRRRFRHRPLRHRSRAPRRIRGTRREAQSGRRVRQPTGSTTRGRVAASQSRPCQSAAEQSVGDPSAPRSGHRRAAGQSRRVEHALDSESREQQRDALLSLARGCGYIARWTCVSHNAGTALQIDSSSKEAQRLMTLAVRETELNPPPVEPAPEPAPDMRDVISHH